MRNRVVRRAGLAALIACGAVCVTLGVSFASNASILYGRVGPVTTAARVLSWSVALWICSVAVGLCYGLVCRRLPIGRLARLTLTESRVALWLPLLQAALGLFTRSTTVHITLGALLAARVVASLRPRRARSARSFDALSIAGRFEVPRTRNAPRMSFVCGALLQCAVVAWIARGLSDALLLLTIATVALMWMAARVDLYQPKPARASLALVMCGVWVTLAMFVITGRGGPAGGGLHINLLSMLADPPAHDAGTRRDDDNLDVMRGIVLMPASKHVAAKLQVSESVPLRFGATMRIPFTGEYRIHREMDVSAPSLSRRQTGSPLDANYSSTDSIGIAMDAVQELATPIDVASCGAVEIGISDRDPFPGTVTVALFLLDRRPTQIRRLNSSFGGALAHMAGAQPVPVPSSNLELHHARLRFEVRDARIERFNVLHFSFQLAQRRDRKSPRMAIDEILLLPRGAHQSANVTAVTEIGSP